MDDTQAKTPSLMPFVNENFAATRKLFHINPDQTTASAKVIAVCDHYVVLDQTIFYAESGGQLADIGIMFNDLAKINVIHVSKHGGRPVEINKTGYEKFWINTDTWFCHHLDQDAPFKVGDCVDLVIDRGRRDLLTRHHTASHFAYFAVEAACLDIFGIKPELRGCLIDLEGFRFDFVAPITSEMLPAITSSMMQMMNNGDPIEKKQSDICDDVFFWQSGNMVMPCGGTHLTKATNMGSYQLSRRSKGKGVVRISATAILA